MPFEKNFAIAAIQSRSPIWGLVETVLISFLLIGLGYFFRPADPFYLSGPFPWTLLAPLLCSLFYGIFNGVLSLGIVLGVLAWDEPSKLFASLLLREYIAGISAVTLLTGLFSSYWFSRILHVEHLNLYVREHLEALSREYYMLRVSHDRLEYAYISKPLSIRDAFFQIQQDVQNNSALEAGQKLLGLFTQFCSINSAIFCQYHPKTHEIRQIALLGKEFPVHLNDSLIQNALKNRATAYVTNDITSVNKSEYLAVIPLIDIEMKPIGWIIIKDMPFWGLTQDNLETLSVFAAYFALQLSVIPAAKNILDIFPSCPAFFARELERLFFLSSHYKVNASLACLVIPKVTEQDNIIYNLQQQKRTLDYIWILPAQADPENKLFITLMPLTGLEGTSGYRNRLDAWLKREFNQQVNQKGFCFRTHLLNKKYIPEQLEQFIKEVNDALA